MNTVFRYFFEDDYYRYQIKYSLQGTVEILSSGISTQSAQGANTRRFYRYIVEDRKISQRVSISMFEGASAVLTAYDMDEVKGVESNNHNGNIVYEGQSSSFAVSKQ